MVSFHLTLQISAVKMEAIEIGVDSLDRRFVLQYRGASLQYLRFHLFIVVDGNFRSGITATACRQCGEERHPRDAFKPRGRDAHGAAQCNVHRRMPYRSYERSVARAMRVPSAPLNICELC